MMDFKSVTFVFPVEWSELLDEKIEKLGLDEQGFFRYTLGIKLGIRTAAENPHGRLLEGEQEAAETAHRVEQTLLPIEGISESASGRLAAFLKQQEEYAKGRPAIEGQASAAIRELDGPDEEGSRFPQENLETTPLAAPVAPQDARNEVPGGVGTGEIGLEAQLEVVGGVEAPTNQPADPDCPHAGWMTRLQPDGSRLCRCGAVYAPEMSS